MPEDGAFSAFSVGAPSKFKKNPDGTFSIATGNVCNGTKSQYNGSCTATAKQIVAANTARQVLYICNVSSTGTLYVGKQGEVSSSYGIPVGAGLYLVDVASYDAWWAAASTGTVNYTVLEIA